MIWTARKLRPVADFPFAGLTVFTNYLRTFYQGFTAL